MISSRLRTVLPAVVLAATVAGSTLTACTSSVPDGSTSIDYSPGTVVRVIDGDTLVITFDGKDQTVRLLNVDTPETKHPDKPVECLGVEATERLEELTPPGTRVALDFDVERTDRYDRVLAAVFIENLTLVNAELARSGLGVPILIEPNRKYYDEVQAAYNEASAQGVGLLDPAAGCTVPAEVDEAFEVLAAATAQPMAESESAAAATAAGIVAALAAAKVVRDGLHAGKDTVRVLALGTGGAASMIAELDRRIASGEKTLSVTNSRAESLREMDAATKREQAEAAAQKERDRVEAEAARVAEEVRVEAERVQAESAARAEADRLAAEAAEAGRLAAEAAERDRIANLPPAPQPYVPPVAPYVPPAPAAPPVPAAPPAPAPAPPAADPFPGYNGPRCYAPGGKIWRPC